MLKLFRASGTASSEDVLAGIATVLSRYPNEVIDHVTGPDGMYSACKWFPTGREITDACETLMVPIQRRQEREARDHAAMAARDEPVRERLSHEDLVARYGKDWGLGKRMPLCEEAYLAARVTPAREPFRTKTHDELLAHYGRVSERREDGPHEP